MTLGRSRGTTFVAFVAPWVLVACGGAPVAEPKVGSATTAVQTPFIPLAPLAPLTLPEVSAKPDADTTVPVLFAVDRTFVDDTVERLVPQRLHEQREREVGPGTKLDLVVTRGKPRYSLKDGALLLELPMELSIDVKSRLGPIELNLGHCAPELLAQVKLPTRLANDLSLPEPDLKLHLKQPCRLSGFDVSELLEQELRKQQQSGERELRQHVRRSAEILTIQARGLEESLDPSDPKCPHLDIQKLVQSPTEEAQGVLSTSLSARGRMAYSCEGAHAGEPLTVAQYRQRLPFDVAEKVVFDWSTLSRVLSPILSQHGLEASPHQLRSAITVKGERIALGVSGNQVTGWIFLTAQVQNGTLRLFAEESEDPALLRQLTSLLVGFTLPVDVKGIEQHARRLLDKTTRLSQIQLSRPELTERLALRAEGLRTDVSTQIVPEGLALSIHVHEPGENP